MLVFRALMLILGLLAISTVPASAAPPLPALGADSSRVSVSGLSSGGFMAEQYSVAYSGSVMGAGIVAGGPYGCAAIYAMVFLEVCMQDSPSGTASWRSAVNFGANGIIDPTDNIRRQRIYLFSGTKDGVVSPKVMKSVRDFYREARLPAANLLYVDTVPAGHAFIATGLGNGCSANEAPYIDKCTVGGQPYDQPGAILSHIYGTLKPQAATLSSAPEPFDQKVYGASGAAMADQGFVYIPASCRAAGAGCAVHVVFHGCVQSASKVGDDVYADLGYNGWADSNGIILLYPQVDASLANPQGCWDWWGYTGLNPQLRSAAQMRAINAMVARLLSPA